MFCLLQRIDVWGVSSYSFMHSLYLWFPGKILYFQDSNTLRLLRGVKRNGFGASANWIQKYEKIYIKDMEGGFLIKNLTLCPGGYSRFLSGRQHKASRGIQLGDIYPLWNIYLTWVGSRGLKKVLEEQTYQSLESKFLF